MSRDDIQEWSMIIVGLLAILALAVLSLGAPIK